MGGGLGAARGLQKKSAAGEMLPQAGVVAGVANARGGKSPRVRPSTAHTPRRGAAGDGVGGVRVKPTVADFKAFLSRH